VSIISPASIVLVGGLKKEGKKMSYIIDSKGVVHFLSADRKGAANDRTKAVEADREYK